MNRKKFLVNSALSVLAVSAFANVKQDGNIFKADCATTNDILGPFYIPDAPVKNDLIAGGMDGTPVLVKGKIFGNDCSTVLKNALVEIWQCNHKGEYDNSGSNGVLRARWYTGDEGSYSFKTILPGKYLNGEKYRPAHIHFRVSADQHQELISQLYFQGDPHIEKDPWASKKEAVERIRPIILEDIAGNLVVNFDIALKNV